MTVNTVASGEGYHEPVLLQEVLGWFRFKSDAIIVDVTLGGAGHAQAILRTSDVRLFGIDRDADAINESLKRLAEFGDRAKVIKGRMSEIDELILKSGVEKVDGILADLGVSSFQLNNAERGFSFTKDAPLDMRMNKDNGESAKELLLRSSEEEIANLIFNLGEEHYSRRIARAIVNADSIETTTELANIISKAVPPKERHRRIHPATKTFQALRIAVNNELGELEIFLKKAPQLLKEGGRLLVISYHSLEDRLVKGSFRALAKEDDFILPVKRVIIPTEEEIEKNPRARSAKMRVLERATSR